MIFPCLSHDEEEKQQEWQVDTKDLTTLDAMSHLKDYHEDRHNPNNFTKARQYQSCPEHPLGGVSNTNL